MIFDIGINLVNCNKFQTKSTHRLDIRLNMHE